MSGKFKEVSDELKGNKYMNHRGEIVEVLNVTTYGRGYHVIYSYTEAYSVYCGLGKFRKRYPIKVGQKERGVKPLESGPRKLTTLA